MTPNTGRSISLRRKYRDRKSTRLNSSHGYISYAVFCLKKKKKTTQNARDQVNDYEDRTRYAELALFCLHLDCSAIHDINQVVANRSVDAISGILDGAAI